jgi:hypothetical protein
MPSTLRFGRRLPTQAFMVECDECSDENKTALILTGFLLVLAFLATFG